jgi:selenocysteine-specific elongation factor
MTLVVGTAGHIDHGKTSLLRALTGIDADRLPEERQRGMTIDVGYAHLALPDGRVVDFVDVPGHDRLIGNMLVGAGEVDAILLVVAADDGPRAQTIEHLELVDALGIEDGIVAITKTDLVDPTRVSDVVDAVRALISRTRLAASAVVPVSAAMGEGLDALLSELGALAGRVTGLPVDGGGARLAIDRVFSVKGRGVVVTGTLRGGSVRRGDTLRVVPGDRSVVVREVQVHGEPVESATAGRTALNLRGVDAGALARGMVLTADARVVASGRLLVRLHSVAPLRAGVTGLPADRTRVRVHLGTEQVDAAVGRTREAVPLANGGSTAVLRLARPIAVAAADRFVLRRSAVRATEAGGIVLDPLPPVGAGRRRITPERLLALADAAAPTERDEALLDLHGARVVSGGVVVAPDVREALERTAIEAVAEHHHAAPAQAGMPLAALRSRLDDALRRTGTRAGDAAIGAIDAVIRDLVQAGRLAREGDRIRTPAFRPADRSPAMTEAMDRLISMLDVPAPPPLSAAGTESGCPPEVIRSLDRDGRIMIVADDLAWSRDAYQSLATEALRLSAEAPLTPAAFRDATGTSRKYVMALLEDLDRRGVLRRTAAGHVPGPRAASNGAAVWAIADRA